MAQAGPSSSPFIHRCSLPPIRGTADTATTPRAPIQKAPLTRTGLNTRDISSPAENENSRRKEPPTMFSVRQGEADADVAERSPYGERGQAAAREQDQRGQSPSGSLRRKSA